MRPAHVYARIPAGQHTELITALHGPWRTATRMVIIVLSAAGWSASEIADLLHYDPATVRRWIARHQHEGMGGLPDRPRSGRPRKGGARLSDRIGRLLLTPKAWTTTRLWRALGRPQISLSTLRRRIREQARWCRPRLIAKSDPDRDQICADIREHIAALPAGSVVLAEDETHLDLLPRIRACWMPAGIRHRVLTPGTNVRRTLHGAINLATGAFHHHVSVKNVSVVFRYLLERLLEAYPNAPRHRHDLRQRLHPPQRHHETLAHPTSTATSHRRRQLQPAGQPRRTDLGRTEIENRQHRTRHDGRPGPSGPRLLPLPHRRRQPHHRRTLDLTLAPRGLRTTLQSRRLASGSC